MPAVASIIGCGDGVIRCAPMKLYTKTGDDGTTGLFGGDRVPKDHPRIHAYGHVDELNAAIGWVMCAISDSAAKPRLASAARKTGIESKSNSPQDLMVEILATLQSRLFDLGADLATPTDSKHESKIQRISGEHVSQAERWIDEIESGNSPQTHFVMPGGTELAARLHLARTVSRRAERAMVELNHTEPVNPQALILMNRVSDLLFAMARRANKEAGVPDVAWMPAKQ